jgi:tRNA/rRNA methyltransferase
MPSERSDSIGRNAPAPASGAAEAALAAVEAAAAGRLAQVRFVLVEPSHAGNIGACARAVRSMGFTRLCLVRPQVPQFRSVPEARALAAGALDVLQQAQEYANLAEALQGVHLAFATTGYAREHAAVPLDVRAAAREAAHGAFEQQAQVAFVFGPERTGLANADVRCCHHGCSIPADPLRGSLNLAQAAQVVAYETRREFLGFAGVADRPAPRRDHTQAAARPDAAPASVEQCEAMFVHLEQGLVALGYLDPQQPRHLMARVRRLFTRATPTATEVDILRGIAAAMVQPRRERIGGKSGR